MAILAKALNCVAILLLAVLIAGAYDVMHLGFGEMLSPLAIVPIALYAIFSIASLFLPTGKGPDGQMDEEGLVAKMDELQSKSNSRLATMQTTLDGMTGQDKESLVEENRVLKEQLEAIQQAEHDKVLSEAEKLRKKNEDLENQIKKWAVQTVGETVAGENAEQAKAA